MPRFDTLEDRRLLSVASPPDASVATAPLATGATVVARSLFYNNSRFDGYTPGVSSLDASAIAADKMALLPGQAAKYAHYTNSLAGINGIMVDIAGLSGTPTVTDFLFHVGNNNALGSWVEAPRPSGFSVQAGAGIGGSTRVTIVWPDGLIRNQWLQVNVRVTGNTGLGRPDVFYFGSAVGETGNSPLLAQTNVTDQLAVRANALSTGAACADRLRIRSESRWAGERDRRANCRGVCHECRHGPAIVLAIGVVCLVRCRGPAHLLQQFGVRWKQRGN